MSAAPKRSFGISALAVAAGFDAAEDEDDDVSEATLSESTLPLFGSAFGAAL